MFASDFQAKQRWSSGIGRGWFDVFQSLRLVYQSTMDKWSELRTVYEVAKLGTVSAAAESLGIHRATVNRQIEILEDTLGVRIFIRHKRGYTLTDIGHEVLGVAQKTDALITDLSGRISSEKAQVGQEIFVTVPAPLTHLVWGPITAFRDRNPHYTVHVVASSERLKLEYGEAHLAVRLGDEPTHPDYVVKSYGAIRMNFYAHETYIKRRGKPTGLSDFPKHDFIVSADLEARWSFRHWLLDNIEPTQVSVSSMQTTVLIEAMRAGLGIGIMDSYGASLHDDLHEIMPGQDDWVIPAWLTTHVDLHRTDKVQAMWRAFMDHQASIGLQPVIS